MAHLTQTVANGGAGAPRRWFAVNVVYLSGLLQGLTLVSFPASSTVMRQMHGFTDAQYGSMFLPQVALAIVGSIVGGTLARRLGLKHLLCLALLANGLSQAALAASVGLNPAGAYGMILFGTACLGFGFGLSGAPLNSFPPMFFPAQRNAAVVALHTALGIGLMAGPLLATFLIGHDLWLGFPVILGVLSFLLVLAVALAALPQADRLLERDTGARAGEGKPRGSLVFWIFAAIAVLYAFAEGTFANWAVIYLHETKKLSETIAALALSAFWGAMAAGRLLVSLIVLRVAAEWVWKVLPVLMIGAFLLMPHADSAARGIGFFALAGLTCSGVFPLTVALVSNRFENDVAWVSSMMIAALMLGVGLGSFVIGPLHAWLSLERLYQVSAVYPLAALILMIVLSRRVAAAAMRSRS